MGKYNIGDEIKEPHSSVSATISNYIDGTYTLKTPSNFEFTWSETSLIGAITLGTFIHTPKQAIVETLKEKPFAQCTCASLDLFRVGCKCGYMQRLRA